MLFSHLREGRTDPVPSFPADPRGIGENVVSGLEEATQGDSGGRERGERGDTARSRRRYRTSRHRRRGKRICSRRRAPSCPAGLRTRRHALPRWPRPCRRRIESIGAGLSKPGLGSGGTDQQPAHRPASERLSTCYAVARRVPTLGDFRAGERLPRLSQRCDHLARPLVPPPSSARALRLCCRGVRVSFPVKVETAEYYPAHFRRDQPRRRAFADRLPLALDHRRHHSDRRATVLECERRYRLAQGLACEPLAPKPSALATLSTRHTRDPPAWHTDSSEVSSCPRVSDSKDCGTRSTPARSPTARQVTA